MSFYKYLFASLFILLLTACNPSNSAITEGSSNQYGQLQFQPCTLTSSAAALGNVEAQCAELEVAENPATPQGHKITLTIAWLEAEQPAENADPVFFLAGGPGQAATEAASIINATLRDVRKQRDIFLLDQRGTGKSSPLICPEIPEIASAEPATQQLKIYAQQCAESLQDRNLAFYTTAEAVADIESVRQALGVSQLNLFGVSYGTRLAQQYAKRYPAQVRTLTLDGIVPNNIVLGSAFAQTFERSLQVQSAACQKSTSCQQRYPIDVQQRLREVVTQLQKSPIDVEYRDPSTNETMQAPLTADTISGLAFAFSYVPQTAALLPLVLDEAAQGRYGSLMSLAQLANQQVSGQINRPLQWSVICTEDADRYQPTSIDNNALLGKEIIAQFYTACAVWPKGERAVDFTNPLNTPVPVLLLSGELDPVTPPEYAQQILTHLPNGKHLVAKGQGHNVMSAGCMPKLINQFIDSSDGNSLETECLDTLTDTPPFTSFNGWAP